MEFWPGIPAGAQVPSSNPAVVLRDTDNDTTHVYRYFGQAEHYSKKEILEKQRAQEQERARATAQKPNFLHKLRDALLGR